MKVVIIVLVVVAVLVIGTTVLGATRGSGQPGADRQQPWLQTAQDLLVPTRNIGVAAIAVLTPQARNTLPAQRRLAIGAGRTCRLAIQPPSSLLPSRNQLVVRLATGLALSIALDQEMEGGKRFTAKADLAAGKISSGMAVYKANATADLACVGTTACQVEFIP